jgi:hypothetical protein
VAEDIYNDVSKWWRHRRIEHLVSPYIPPTHVEQWVIADVSELTGTVVRYWRGTDRDHWHKEHTFAAVFPSERVARIYQQQFMVEDYYPRSRPLIISI